MPEFWPRQYGTSGLGEIKPLRRFSSRRRRLDHAFLNERLRGAKAYRRIAGYFRSSIFELVGEEIAQIPKVQVVCNSELDAADVRVAQHARETALKERWNEAAPEVEALLYRDRYRCLHDLLTSGRVEIRVVPKEQVFIHGKAGLIDHADNTTTCFLGFDQRDKERVRDELRDPVGRPFARRSRMGGGGVRSTLERCGPLARCDH